MKALLVMFGGLVVLVAYIGIHSAGTGMPLFDFKHHNTDYETYECRLTTLEVVGNPDLLMRSGVYDKISAMQAGNYCMNHTAEDLVSELGLR
jgi:hypothetical protein